MSSTATVDRKTNEILRKERKAASQKEEQTQLRHDAQMEELRRNQANKLREIEDRYENNLLRYKERSTEAISDRDLQHRREIEDLKDLYSQKLKKSSMDKRREQIRLDEINDNRLRVNNQIQDDKFNYLNEKYGRNITANREGYEQIISEKNDGFKEALIDQKRESALAHQKNKNLISESHRDQMGDVKRQFRRYQEHTKDSERRTSQRNNDRLNQVADSHKRYVDDLKTKGLDDQEFFRDTFRDKLDETRENYNMQLGKERDRIFSEVRSRQQNEVEYLQGKVENLHRENARDKLKTKRQADRQVENIQKKSDRIARAYSEQQQRFINDTNDQARKMSGETHEFYQGRLSQADRNYKEKLGMTEQVLRDHYREERNRLENLRNQDNSRADLRVKMAEQSKNREIKRLVATQNEQIRVLKEQFNQEKNKIRDIAKMQNHQQVNKLRDQLNTKGHKEASEVIDIKSEYQSRIDDLAHQKDREKRIMREAHAKVVRERRNSHQNQIYTMKSKYETKIAKLKENYEEQLNQLSDIHKEQMDQAYNHMRTADHFSKKA